MTDFSHVVLIGRLTRDAELRYTAFNKRIATKHGISVHGPGAGEHVRALCPEAGLTECVARQRTTCGVADPTAAPREERGPMSRTLSPGGSVRTAARNAWDYLEHLDQLSAAVAALETRLDVLAEAVDGFLKLVQWLRLMQARRPGASS